MLTAREIDMEISNRETGPSTMQTVEQLALLYIVRDHLYPSQPEPEPIWQPPPEDYSRAPGPPPDASEFVALAMSIPVDALLGILDEHMEAVRMLYPKEYNAVLRRLNDARA